MPSPLFTAIIPGRPVPYARPRVTRHGTYNPRRKDMLVIADQLWLLRPAKSIRVAVSLHLLFCYAPPKSWSKKKRVAAIERQHVPTRHDLDNLIKCYLDCCTMANLWADDKLVCHIDATKLYKPEEYTSIEIWPWGNHGRLMAANHGEV